jgi:hypothetical protein
LTYTITLYSRNNPRGTNIDVEARGWAEASRLRRVIMNKRIHEIRSFAARIKGTTVTETRRKRKEALSQIGWLHSVVERNWDVKEGQ